MKEIKTKPEGGKPKLLESAAKAPKTAMKDFWLKSKEKSVSEIKETPFANQQGESSNAPANTAGDQMLSGMESTAKKGADLTYRGGKSWRRLPPRPCGRNVRWPAFASRPRVPPQKPHPKRERPPRVRPPKSRPRTLW